MAKHGKRYNSAVALIDENKSYEPAEGIPWDRLYLFWGDERYVPYDHPESNYRTAHEALIRHIPVPPGHVFPIPTQASSPEAAAEAYASTLKQFFAGR